MRGLVRTLEGTVLGTDTATVGKTVLGTDGRRIAGLAGGVGAAGCWIGVGDGFTRVDWFVGWLVGSEGCGLGGVCTTSAKSCSIVCLATPPDRALSSPSVQGGFCKLWAAEPLASLPHTGA